MKLKAPEEYGYTIRDGSAFNLSGNYIGSPETADYICRKNGIAPEISTPGDGICSIGFNKDENKWYGWSHRAMCGFTIGDTVKEGDCTASSGWDEEYLKAHPDEDFSLPVGFVAKTLDDARKMAVAFAESVS